MKLMLALVLFCVFSVSAAKQTALIYSFPVINYGLAAVQEIDLTTGMASERRCFVNTTGGSLSFSFTIADMAMDHAGNLYTQYDAKKLVRMNFQRNETEPIQLRGQAFFENRTLTTAALTYNSGEGVLITYDTDYGRMCKIDLEGILRGNVTCGHPLAIRRDSIDTTIVWSSELTHGYFVGRRGDSLFNQSLFQLSDSTYFVTPLNTSGWERHQSICGLAWTGKSDDDLIAARCNHLHFASQPDYGYVYDSVEIGKLTHEGHFESKLSFDCKDFGKQGCSLQLNLLQYSEMGKLVLQQQFEQTYGYGFEPPSQVEFYVMDQKEWKIVSKSPHISNSSYIMFEMDVVYSEF